MTRFIGSMNGTWGRLGHIVLGLALIALGLTVLGDTTGLVLTVVGLVLLGIGLSARGHSCCWPDGSPASLEDCGGARGRPVKALGPTGDDDPSALSIRPILRLDHQSPMRYPQLPDRLS